MARSLLLLLLEFLLCLTLAASVRAGNSDNNNGDFNIVNGQIYTPGLAILDSPQPNTPEGGDFLQVAMDISGDGKLSQPFFPPDSDTGTLNITMFLFSYTTGLNLTISNGTFFGWRNASFEDQEFHCNATTTQGFQNAGCQEIMAQESSSTVKHVNWAWPDCLVGGGGNDDSDGQSRGSYNISIHQTFKINDKGFYSIFNLPIEVTNTIPQLTKLSTFGQRPLCSLRENPLQDQTAQDASINPPPSQPYLGMNVGGSNQGGSSGGSSSNPSGALSEPTPTDAGALPTDSGLAAATGAAGNASSRWAASTVQCLLMLCLVAVLLY